MNYEINGELSVAVWGTYCVKGIWGGGNTFMYYMDLVIRVIFIEQ